MSTTHWMGVADDEGYFDLVGLRASLVVKELHDNAWLVRTEDLSSLSFAVVEFVSSNLDGTDTKVEILFHGWGPSDTLRECRHTYWGEDGYVFYIKRKTLICAMEALSEFFDLD